MLSCFRGFCTVLVLLSVLSSIPFLYWSHSSVSFHFREPRLEPRTPNNPIDLLTFPSDWNHLSFPLNPPQKLLKIAVFVKKWPDRGHAGGLERHALTLHLALAKRGHELHVFTASSNNLSFPKYPFKNLHFHLSKPTAAGYLDQALIWEQFQSQNSTNRPFDLVHTESVSLRHTRSKYVSNLAVSWHGIAYESIHSDIIQELQRSPNENQTKSLTERSIKVVEEIKFFQNYPHHVATSDHVGNILKRIYMIPENRVHVILNGVDEDIFKPDYEKGQDFRSNLKIPPSKSLILGMAGRLVKDKGHPLMFEALKQIFSENSTLKETVMVLVAGDGPWGSRYKDLGSNLIVLGPLQYGQLARFYNAIDVFVNPTLRAQGLDHTLLEAVLSGKPLMATKLASITGSVITGKEFGILFRQTLIHLRNVFMRFGRMGDGFWRRKVRWLEKEV